MVPANLISVVDLHLSLGGMPILRGINLAIEQGDVLGIVGESAMGKSTLGRCLVGLERPSSGSVRFLGDDVHAKRFRTSPGRRALQFLFQDPTSALDPKATVERTLREALGAAEGQVACSTAAIEALLADVGLDAKYVRRFPHQLSVGERQRLCLARVLALRPRVVVADEPTSALDVIVKTEIAQQLRMLADREITLVLISHDLPMVRRLCSAVVVLFAGRVVECGSVEEVLESPAHPYTRALLAVESSADSSAISASGCAFRPRCRRYAAHHDRRCEDELPDLLELSDDHRIACHQDDSGAAPR
ncbi:MAG: ATP-binding cassette domain-containing protein [Deltaproteobacteria bacterium]|nr:ATP-binding cassette domain-containing protein [Deltaproteobacteria bacterium]